MILRLNELIHTVIYSLLVAISICNVSPPDNYDIDSSPVAAITDHTPMTVQSIYMHNPTPADIHRFIHVVLVTGTTWHQDRRFAGFPCCYGGHIRRGFGVMPIVNVLYECPRSPCLFRGMLAEREADTVYVRFSYVELGTVVDDIIDYWHDNHHDCWIMDAYVTHRLSECQTYIMVVLHQDYYSEELKNAFRRYVSDSPMIVLSPGLPHRFTIFSPCAWVDICVNEYLKPDEVCFDCYQGELAGVRIPGRGLRSPFRPRRQ